MTEFSKEEEEYDKVPREILKCALMRKEVPKIYINLIQDKYKGSRICVEFV
jgi:hypothetical protein